MATVTRSKEMAVSVKALYTAITDFKQYPDFLPEVVSAQIESGATSEKARVRFELEIVKRFQYTLEFEMLPQQQVKWELADSDFFKVNTGRWKLAPVSDQRTDVNYELDVGFGFFVPKWIAKKLTEVNLPRMFEAFELRAESIG